MNSRGVLLIGIDGLRADHLSCYGYDRVTTPTLDALAEDGVAFTQMFTSSPVVIPAHISLFTGTHPGVARRFLPGELEGLGERRWRIPGRVSHLAVEFLASRYATAAFLDSPLLDPVYGFGPGFQVYEVLKKAPGQRVSRTRLSIDRFVTWMRNQGDKSWFAYLHLHALEDSWARPDREWERFFEPRAELSQVPPVGNIDATFFAVPRSRWKGGARTLGDYEAAYDGHLRKLDAEIERLLGHLRRSGRYENTSIYVVGTHGMQLGEAGLYVSSGRYSQADLGVPWIVRTADSTPRGRKIDALVSLVDVPPTLLAMEGLAVPRGMHGHSRADLILGLDGQGADFVFASGGIQEGCAVIGERYCLEYLAPESLGDAELRRSWLGERSDEPAIPMVRFYDRLADPFPALAASTEGPPRLELARYRKALHTWLDNMSKTQKVLQPNSRSRDGVDPAEIERLIELGYVGRLR
jgi:arylsulfatase